MSASEYLVITIPAGLHADLVRATSDKVIIKLVAPTPPAVHRPIKSNRPMAFTVDAEQ